VPLRVAPRAAHFPDGRRAKRALGDFFRAVAANEGRAAARREVDAQLALLHANHAGPGGLDLGAALA
jgi:hypothetical protein